MKAKEAHQMSRDNNPVYRKVLLVIKVAASEGRNKVFAYTDKMMFNPYTGIGGLQYNEELIIDDATLEFLKEDGYKISESRDMRNINIVISW